MSRITRSNEIAEELTGFLVDAQHDQKKVRKLLENALLNISQPDFLLELIDEIIKDQKYMEYCYKNNNGFYIIFIADPEIGTQFRIHLWIDDGVMIDEQPHRHRMSFASRVLSGKLVSTSMIRKPTSCAKEENSELYQEGIIKVPNGNFDTPLTRYEELGVVCLERSNAKEYSEGECYYFDFKDIHVVKTEFIDEKPNISLTVWDLPHQDSVVYEPLTSKKIKHKSIPVIRPKKSEFIRLLNIVKENIKVKVENIGSMT